MNPVRTLKILIVDDRKENLDSLRQLLERPDLEILTAGSGNEALGLMLHHDLALVLLDVQMPGMDGFEVAELMRRNEKTRTLPVIFVTAINKERRHIFSGYEAGAVDYLFKPVDPFIIRAKVGVFLDLKKAQLAREKLVAELNRANRRLQDVSELKSDYLSSASHELRTPLTVIKENCSLVLDEVVGPLTPDQKKLMDASLRNANRLASLVNDLLDLDSIESGYTPVDRGRLDIADCLAQAVEDFRPGCESAGQRLELELVEDMPPVLGDRGMIVQIVVNLVGNAVKFTPAAGCIRVRALRQGDAVRVEVHDDGPGIALEDQERIFEKFAQVGRSDGPGAKGTGLGLAISQKLAAIQEGELGLHSRPGAGSTFHFTVPVFDDRRHLRAFVMDGTRNVLGLAQEWTLVLLQDRDGQTGPPGWLKQEAERVVRYGQDRIAVLRIADRPRLAVLIKSNRNGSMAFLARLEEILARRPGEAANLQYTAVDLPPEVHARFRLNEEQLEFHDLSLTVEPEGASSE